VPVRRTFKNALNTIIQQLPICTIPYLPVVVETLGLFGKSTNDFIRVLGRKITVVTGEIRATDLILYN
jgi:predicted alpha/beta-fold hydrolase